MTTGTNPYKADIKRDHANPHREQGHDRRTVCNNSSCVCKAKAGRSKTTLRERGSAQSKHYVNAALIQVTQGSAFMHLWCNALGNYPIEKGRAAAFPGNGTWLWIRDGAKTVLREASAGKKAKKPQPICSSAHSFSFMQEKRVQFQQL